MRVPVVSRSMRTRGHTASIERDDSALAGLIEAGPYSTDGVRLFRLAGVVSGSSGPKLVQLEDCRSLDVSEYTDEEVALLDLVPVTARPAADGGRESARAAGHHEHGHRARAHES